MLKWQIIYSLYTEPCVLLTILGGESGIVGFSQQFLINREFGG